MLSFATFKTVKIQLLLAINTAHLHSKLKLHQFLIRSFPFCADTHKRTHAHTQTHKNNRPISFAQRPAAAADDSQNNNGVKWTESRGDGIVVRPTNIASDSPCLKQRFLLGVTEDRRLLLRCRVWSQKPFSLAFRRLIARWYVRIVINIRLMAPLCHSE